GEDLWRLVARWFQDQVERVLRRDWIRDYTPVHEGLRLVRGRVDPMRTALNYYAGRIEIPCGFDEFSIDTPLNRVLRAASQVVAASPVLDRELRRRARSVLTRLDPVGEVGQADLRAEPDRRTKHYREALILAKHILRGRSRTLAHGEGLAWTF